MLLLRRQIKNPPMLSRGERRVESDDGTRFTRRSRLTERRAERNVGTASKIVLDAATLALENPSRWPWSVGSGSIEQQKAPSRQDPILLASKDAETAIDMPIIRDDEHAIDGLELGTIADCDKGSTRVRECARSWIKRAECLDSAIARV
jgi:hypothetical protein